MQCFFRKADLRELKRLHVQENRLMQALASKALAAKEEQIKKFEIDKQVLAYVVCAYTKAQFPLPELTARVDR